MEAAIRQLWVENKLIIHLLKIKKIYYYLSKKVLKFQNLTIQFRSHPCCLKFLARLIILKNNLALQKHLFKKVSLMKINLN